MNILKMNRAEILRILPGDISRILFTQEIIYMAKTLNAFWSYNYKFADEGIAGKHALLKSGLHSDGFIIAREFLKYPAIRMIMAEQLVMHFDRLGIADPDCVTGIPNGATELGRDVSKILRSRFVRMEKINGQIKMVDKIPPGNSLLIVEDLCTKGTGFSEAVCNISGNNKGIHILPYELVLINRGELENIIVHNLGSFEIVAAAEHRINDWEEKVCPLCNKYHSIPITPKDNDENWKEINNSQII